MKPWKKISYQPGRLEKSARSDVLRRLRAFLDANEPDLVYFLVNTWRAQGKAITYKEIREALLAGDIDQAILDRWHEDYSIFVVERLLPAWRKAMEEATAELSAQFPVWRFDPYSDGVKEWVEQRGAAFVTNVSSAQIEGLRAVLQKAAVLEEMGVDQLARAVRGMVGLTKPQAVANLNYYTNLIKNGTSEKRAQDLSIRYAARQHRYRGYNIARTELAFAYNKGAYEGAKQAQEKGYLGEAVKEWCTADDERVCEICGKLDGLQVRMDEDFPFSTKLEGREPGIKLTPPAHPSCRCGFMVKQIQQP